MTHKKRRKKKYWYEFYFSECVLCGKQRNYRERRYGRRPADPIKRYHFEQFACDEHFL